MWTDTGCVVITAMSHQTNTHKWSGEVKQVKSCLASMKKFFFFSFLVSARLKCVYYTKQSEKMFHILMCRYGEKSGLPLFVSFITIYHMHINAMFPKLIQH